MLQIIYARFSLFSRLVFGAFARLLYSGNFRVQQRFSLSLPPSLSLSFSFLHRIRCEHQILVDFFFPNSSSLSFSLSFRFFHFMRKILSMFGYFLFFLFVMHTNTQYYARVERLAHTRTAQ